jgi:hypothetical protein
MKEICICAAIMIGDKIIRGHRHCDCFATARRCDIEIGGEYRTTQGFITSRNRFVDRYEAAELQNAAGIKSVDTCTEINKVLLSEDLYWEGEAMKLLIIYYDREENSYKLEMVFDQKGIDEFRADRKEPDYIVIAILVV